MDKRILAIGVPNLPAPIKCVSWESIITGELTNISDFDIVFIDFSSIPYESSELIVLKCLNAKKFYEVLKSGVELYILGTASGYHHAQDGIFSWVPRSIYLETVNESGNKIKTLDNNFEQYFSKLSKWTFYYVPIISSTASKEYEIVPVAYNRAEQLIGFCLRDCVQTLPPMKPANGSIYFLHTLGAFSNEGVLAILKSMYGFSTSRQKPLWVGDTNTKKSSELKETITLISEQVNKLNTDLSEHKNALNSIEYYGNLLWETGKELEDVVHASLKLMGLNPSPPTQSDDDGRFTYGKQEFMLEIKSSLQGSASFGELSKLITRLENENTSHNKNCRGVFIMNHYADWPVDERDKPFPKNVIETAKINGVRLISTQELFDIVRCVLDDEISPEEAVKRFLG